MGPIPRVSDSVGRGEGGLDFAFPTSCQGDAGVNGQGTSRIEQCLAQSVNFLFRTTFPVPE